MFKIAGKVKYQKLNQKPVISILYLNCQRNVSGSVSVHNAIV